jgi:hypothetical protein
VKAAVEDWGDVQKIIQIARAEMREEGRRPATIQPTDIEESIRVIFHSLAIRMSFVKAQVYTLLGLYIRMICETKVLSVATKVNLLAALHDAKTDRGLIGKLVKCVTTLGRFESVGEKPMVCICYHVITCEDTN